MLLPPFNFPENIVLLITDTLPSPASFLLHKALSSHLKSSKPAIVVSVSEDLAKWKAIASRSVRPEKSQVVVVQPITYSHLHFPRTSTWRSTWIRDLLYSWMQVRRSANPPTLTPTPTPIPIQASHRTNRLCGLYLTRLSMFFREEPVQR